MWWPWVLAAVLAILLALVLLAAYVWFVKPSIIVNWYFGRLWSKSGMRVKRVTGATYVYCYGEKGEPSDSIPSLLLIHGFSSSKQMYADLARRLPKNIHVVALDLPGHGETSEPPDGDVVSVDVMYNCLNEFVELVGLSRKPFHLVGSSLGGVICGAYSIVYREHVERLTLMCPAFDTPIKTEFSKLVDEGECNLLPETVEELRGMLPKFFHKKDAIPQHTQLLKGTLQLLKPKNALYHRLFQDLIKDKDQGPERFRDHVKLLTCPTQLIWGREDQLIHISGAENLKKVLPNVRRVDIFEECGHSIGTDCPEQLVKAILNFRAMS